MFQSAILLTAFFTIISTQKRSTKHTSMFYNEYVVQLLCQNEHVSDRMNILFNCFEIIMKILTTVSVIRTPAMGVYERRQGDDHNEHKDCQFESVHV